MAWRIIKQPNGRYARFSEVVDNFTHGDMTREEALDLCLDYMGREDVERKVANADAEPARWQESLDTIKLIHGEDELAKVLAEMSDLPPAAISCGDATAVEAARNIKKD